MRHTISRLMGLMLVLALVLSGCNLVGIDPIMQLDEDLAAKVKQFSGVVASYDGGEITQADVMSNLVSQYSYMSQMYSMYGMNMTSDVLNSIEESVVQGAVEDVAIAKQIESRGLKLSDEKLAEVQTKADESYQQAYDSLYGQATGKDDVRAKQAEFDAYANGYSKEGLYALELAAANRELIEDAVKGEIAEVTDEQLQTAYDEKVASDESSYADAPGSFESAMSSSSSIVCWIPEGYRTVKHILVKPEDTVLTAFTDARSAYKSAQSALEDLQAELDALNDDDAGAEAEEAAEGEEAPEATEAPRTAEEIQADIDAAEANLATLKTDMESAASACIASVQDKLDEIYGKIEAGEDFSALIAEYGEDPGMKNEPTATRGYYVSARSTAWDQAFTDGAMSLEKVGDVTMTPVVSGSGVHIIRYESDVTPGAVALDDVREQLTEDTLKKLQDDHYSSELQSWVSALNAEYHLDAFDLN